MVKPGESDPTQDYAAYSHGVFLRNAHGQEVITKPDSLVWRTLGGSVDLTIYSGPSQEEVTKNYQISTIGLPAMQQYSALGYHQARWGYANWSVMADVVATFEKFEIPLEYLWYVPPLDAEVLETYYHLHGLCRIHFAYFWKIIGPTLTT